MRIFCKVVIKTEAYVTDLDEDNCGILVLVFFHPLEDTLLYVRNFYIDVVNGKVV